MDEFDGATIRFLMEFIGETGVQMDTKLKVAGKKTGSFIR